MNISVDIDIDELMWKMSHKEKKQMLDLLLNDLTNTEEKFNLNLISLLGKSWRLTNEEEKLINEIAERYS
jgi:hypothetical protein